MKYDIANLIKLTEEKNLKETDLYYHYLVFEQAFDLTSSSPQPQQTFMQKHGKKLAFGGAALISGLVGQNYLQNHPQVGNQLSQQWNKLSNDVKTLSNNIASKVKSGYNNVANLAKEKSIDYNLLHSDFTTKTDSELLAARAELLKRGANIANLPGGDHRPIENALKAVTQTMKQRAAEGHQFPKDAMNITQFNNLGTGAEKLARAREQGGLTGWFGEAKKQTGQKIQNFKQSVNQTFYGNS